MHEQLPEIKNTHPKLVVRNFDLVSDHDNTLNLRSVAIEYGFGDLDGLVSSLVLHGPRTFSPVVDLGAHAARHIRNSNLYIKSLSAAETGTLAEALSGGRDYSYSSSSLALNGSFINFSTYLDLFLRMIFENLELGFAGLNYHRPFYCPSDRRLDGLDIDPRIAQSLYEGLFSIMSLYWPDILGPRSVNFSGLNVLLSLETQNPYPNPSCAVQYKGAGHYSETRARAVAEKERFMKLFGAELAAAFGAGAAIHDVLLLDYSRQFATELSGSNLLLLTSGEALTPVTTPAIFPGLTRDFGLVQLKGELGNALGVKKVHERNITLDALKYAASQSGELLASGSALGFIPVRRVFVPKNENPQSLKDYDIIEFRVGPQTMSAVLSDVYRCFSTSQGARVSAGGKTFELDEFVGWNVMVEIPPELGKQAVHRYTLGGKLEVPPDMVMKSGKVVPFRVPSKERVVTMEDHRRGRLFAAVR